VQTARLTRRESTELTRRRLIDGAIDILRQEGVAAATTGRIASAAGLKQPSFYVHFADRDEILHAAAVEIGQRMIEKLQGELSRIDTADARRSIRAAHAAIVDTFLAEPELTRIFLRHRTDDGTVLGRAFRRLLDEARGQLVDSLARHGITVPRQSAVVYAELLVAAVLGMLEGLLDGRLTDRAASIDAVAHVTGTMMHWLPHAESKERREGK
jgi:TetR/AcrR family transcriptional regulator, fatty acid biosynthesis regulator